MKVPSEKQIKFARKISNELYIPLPTDYTAKAYYDFIHDNIVKYNTHTKSIDDELAEECFSGMLDY